MNRTIETLVGREVTMLWGGASKDDSYADRVTLTGRVERYSKDETLVEVETWGWVFSWRIAR